MNNIFAAFLLICCISLFCTSIEAVKVKVNLKEHGYDGELNVDTKTGLLYPPLEYPDPDAADKLTLGGPFSHLYCKVLASGTVFHDRYYTNDCGKIENGKKIDLCCAGYTCTDYGLFTGIRGYCEPTRRG